MMPTALNRRRSRSDSALAESKKDSPLNATIVKVSMKRSKTKRSDGDEDNGIAACCLFLTFSVITTAVVLLVVFWPSIEPQKAEPSKVLRIEFKLTIALPVGFPLERSGEETAPTVVHQTVEVNDEKKCIKIETSKLAGMHPCTFIHDFGSNMTAIVDPTRERCFIFELKPEMMTPPNGLLELAEKIRNGEFALANVLPVRQSYTIGRRLDDAQLKALHSATIYTFCSMFETYCLRTTDEDETTSSSTVGIERPSNSSSVNSTFLVAGLPSAADHRRAASANRVAYGYVDGNGQLHAVVASDTASSSQ